MPADSRTVPFSSEATRFWAWSLGAAAVYLVSPICEFGDSLKEAVLLEHGAPLPPFDWSRPLWALPSWLAWAAGRLLAPHLRPFPLVRIAVIAASAAGVGAAAVWLRRRLPKAPAFCAAVLFATGYAWWAYATSGCVYTASTALALGALAVAWPEPGRDATPARQTRAAVLAGLAALMWLPQALTGIAVALALALRGSADRAALEPRRAARFAVVFAGLVAAGLLAGWLAAGRIASPAAMDIAERPAGFNADGLAGAAYGWTRLLWQPWRLDVDRAQPQGWGRALSAQPLWGWELWKPLAAYLLAALALLAGTVRRVKWSAHWTLLLAWALAHALFACFFRGADPERWLPAWGAVLAGLTLWALGRQPGRARTALVCAALLAVAAAQVAERFSPRGDVESRPQMKLLRGSQGKLQPGDLVIFGGELDEHQHARTVQIRWGYAWLYFADAGAVDCWTWPLPDFEWSALRFTGVPRERRRYFVSEQLLGGIPHGAETAPGAEDRRNALMESLPPGPPSAAFSAADEGFYRLARAPRPTPETP